MTTQTTNRQSTKQAETRANGFEAQLHRIRSAGIERRTRGQHERSEAARARSQRIMRALESVHRVEAVLARLTRELGEELGRHVKISRGLFDGRYQLGLRLAETRRDAEGRGTDYFSRVQLLLEPRAEEGRLVIECRSTVHNRDLGSTVFEDELNERALERIQAFLEEQLLAFAKAWCASDELTRAEDLLDLAWAEAAMAA